MDIRKIPLEKVKPSPMNPRKTIDEGSLQELADNIAKQGLLQPITVRPVEYYDMLDEDTNEIATIPTSYEIVCGERRYRALLILKEKEDALNIERVAAHRKKSDNYQTIASIVREMTDDEAFEAMITENLQRKDVDPIEESFAFVKLMEKGKSLEDIAVRFGKSIRFVQDRIKLNTLIPELMVAVRDDKCSISAAMLICKLDEEHQYKWYAQSSAYNRMNKDSAKNFIRDLFMDIDSSPWYDSDDQNDEAFSGGCGLSCSECQYNTANHACLFWEMKGEGEGRCTNREMFSQKNIAYLLHVIDKESENFVKKGQPLEYGKTVVIKESGYHYGDDTKLLFESAEKAIDEAGYEVMESSDIFRNRCWYDEGDERLDKMLKSGEVYRCLSFMRYNRIEPDFEYYYIKKAVGSEDGSSQQNVQALDFANKYKRNNDIYTEKLTADLRILADTDDVKDLLRSFDKTLSNEEIKALMLCIIVDAGASRNLSDHILEDVENGQPLCEWLDKNKDKYPTVVREYMRYKISSSGVNYDRSMQTAQQILMEQWAADRMEEIVSKHKSDLDKKQRKLEEKLAELGYDTNGQLLNK
jgi:ParB-like chromosome segregation protein Spo0J